MGKIWKQGDSLILSDTGEYALFEAYAELEGYAYVLTTDDGEMLVHLDDIVSHTEQMSDSFEVEVNTNEDIIEKPKNQNKGLWMAISPHTKQTKQPQFLAIWLCSTNVPTIEISAQLIVHGEEVFEENFELTKNEEYFICELYRQDLGSFTSLQLTLALKGGEWMQEGKRIKLNPQKLMKCFESEQVLWLLIQDEISPSNNSKTSSKVVEPPRNRTRSIQPKYRMVFPGLNPLESAQLNASIDLHIEALYDDHSRLHARDIIRIQLNSAIDYLDKAYRSSWDEVYLIHGIGSGRLRDKIHELLRHRPDVLFFSNEYHPRFGWGATVVRFKR
jgi:hypothetical protein